MVGESGPLLHLRRRHHRPRLPISREGLRSLAGGAALDTDALVATATIASLLLRENATALVVLWLLNLGELLQSLTLRRVHRAIQVST